MKNFVRSGQGIAGSLALLAIGYCLGSLGLFQANESSAQPSFGFRNNDEIEVKVDLSDQSISEIKAANDALARAMETLRLEGKYKAAASDINAYAILTGGFDAIDDLERGHGVDPVTYAHLYAGKAVPEVRDELTRDEKNRLYYKNQLIRMYAVERLETRQKMGEAILQKRVSP